MDPYRTCRMKWAHMEAAAAALEEEEMAAAAVEAEAKNVSPVKTKIKSIYFH